MATITAKTIKLIDQYFMRPCEFNERGEIVYRDKNYNHTVGYIAEGEYDGWLVDTTGDRDKLVKNVC